MKRQKERSCATIFSEALRLSLRSFFFNPLEEVIETALYPDAIQNVAGTFIILYYFTFLGDKDLWQAHTGASANSISLSDMSHHRSKDFAG
jgi:hypothetical protein